MNVNDMTMTATEFVAMKGMVDWCERSMRAIASCPNCLADDHRESLEQFQKLKRALSDIISMVDEGKLRVNVEEPYREEDL